MTRGNLNMVTTWRIPCGIATYSSHLASALLNGKHFDSIHVYGEHTKSYVKEKERKDIVFHPEWERPEPRIPDQILSTGDPLIIQNEWGFFSFKSLVEMGKRHPGSSLTLHTLPIDPARFKILSSLFRFITITPSQYSYLKLLGSSNENLTYIPHGVYQRWKTLTDNKRTSLRENLGIKPEEQIICLHSYLNPEKGYHAVTLAMRLLKKKLPNSRLLVVGSIHPSAPRNREVRTYVKSLMYSAPRDSIFKLGFFTDSEFDKLLSCADVFIHPLNEERIEISASGSACTSLSYGKPIIKSSSIRLDFLTGPCTSPSARDISDRLFDILNDPNVHLEESTRSRNLSELYSWSNSAKRHAEFCDGEQQFNPPVQFSELQRYTVS